MKEEKYCEKIESSVVFIHTVQCISFSLFGFYVIYFEFLFKEYNRHKAQEKII